MNLLDVYSIVDLTVARIARFLPNTLVQWVQRQISHDMR